MSAMRIGIIGGSGLYNIDGLSGQRWEKVETPFGDPSDEFLIGELEGREVVFLPRHGRGHRLLPSELNHRANIYAMKKLGVEWIISVSAVGSLQEKIKMGDIVLVDQFIDNERTIKNHTFFGKGIVAHVSFAHPVCDNLRAILYKAAQKCAHQDEITIHNGGTYVNMEGPAFSTIAESQRNHNMGWSVIGMTGMGEARCAREAEISYATLAIATDYDAWKQDNTVTIEMVVNTLQARIQFAKELIRYAIPDIPCQPLADWPAHSMLKGAILTDRSVWPQERIDVLKPILQKYL